MSVSLPPDKLADIQQLALSAEPTCDSPLGHDHFREGLFLYQWPLPTADIVSYHSE